MKNKKVLIIGIILIGILGGCCYYIYSKAEQKKEENQITEYTPAEEITQEQLRQTIVSLYFNNKDTNTLVPEARSVDVKELTKDPYTTLLNLLIQGPKNERLENVIPEGTKVNKVELQNNTIYVDFSIEFIENHKGGAEEESKTVYAIVNTLTQLNEINAVKINIDSKEDQCFKDNQVTFNNAFVRKD